VKEEGTGDDNKVPQVTESVSVSEDGTINITLNNLSLESDKEVEINFDDLKVSSVEASVVTGSMNAHNTFDDAEAVTTKKLENVTVTDKGIKVVLPACSVTGIRVKG
jgi:alpha-N-arabinofuranosidase